MKTIIAAGITLFMVFCAVFVVLFLGGLASAALEVRRERRAGLEPTRPAWDNAVKRRALGGLVPQIKAAWANARHPIPSCWCGQGPLVEFVALDSGDRFGPGLGCAAVEAGDPVAILRHDEAGGYARTPVSR